MLQAPARPASRGNYSNACRTKQKNGGKWTCHFFNYTSTVVISISCYDCTWPVVFQRAGKQMFALKAVIIWMIVYPLWSALRRPDRTSAVETLFPVVTALITSSSKPPIIWSKFWICWERIGDVVKLFHLAAQEPSSAVNSLVQMRLETECEMTNWTPSYGALQDGSTVYWASTSWDITPSFHQELILRAVGMNKNKVASRNLDVNQTIWMSVHMMFYVHWVSLGWNTSFRSLGKLYQTRCSCWVGDEKFMIMKLALRQSKAPSH